MSTIEQIKAEIERRIKIQDDWAGRKVLPGRDLAFAVKEELKQLLSFLSTLETEKPMNQEVLEEEIIKCWQEWISPSNKQSVEGVLPLSEFAFYARHFAQWGAERLADAHKTSSNDLEEPVCEELSNETLRIEFKKIEHQCFEEGIVGWQKEKLIARHFYDLGLNARKEG